MPITTASKDITQRATQELEGFYAGKEFENPYQKSKKYAEIVNRMKNETPKTTGIAAELNNTLKSPVSSTTGIREDQDIVKSDSADMLSGLQMGSNLSAQMGDISGVFQAAQATNEQIQRDRKELMDLQRNLGNFSESEEARIKAAGEAAAADYAPLIAEAQESARLGKPKALISAGERGGFMNTQLSGAAAVTQTQGGTFAGQGGELERINSVYDRNISNMQAKQKQAQAAAEEALRTSIKTGKRSDMDFARKMLEDAQASNMESIRLANEKVDMVAKLEASQRAGVEFGQQQEQYAQGQEDREIESVVGALQSALTGDPASDQQVIEQVAAARGIDPVRLMSGINQWVDQKNKEALDTLEQRVGIASEIPEGEVVTDPESGITIVGSKDPEIIKVIKTIGTNEYRFEYTRNSETGELEQVGEPIGLGPKYKPTSAGSGGGGTLSDEDKEIQKLRSDAADEIVKLDTDPNYPWSAAFDQLKVKYPNAGDDALNGLLGGGIPFDSQTGEFGTAFGRAERPKQ